MLEVKKVKKALFQGRIRITEHARKRMDKRGYTQSDIISCICSGEQSKLQFFSGKVRIVIEGRDTDKLPMVVIVGKDDKYVGQLAIVSVFPPLEEKFKYVI